MRTNDGAVRRRTDHQMAGQAPGEVRPREDRIRETGTSVSEVVYSACGCDFNDA